ncbi:MAG: putative spermidine/putrescine transport system permease protein [Thermoleophilales bacterium]|nr:putative spermidine/putrescine transport system permease protein [Thermoleophilales bacterium]
MPTTSEVDEPGRASARPGSSGHRAWDSSIGNWRALLLVSPLVVLLALFVFYPLVKLGIDSVTAGEGVRNYSTALESPAVRRALITTMVAGVVITVLSVGIGALLAWYLRTVQSPVALALLWLAVLAPFWLGTVVKNYAIILLFSRNGALNDLLGLVGVGPLSILYKPGAVIFGTTYTMIPYAVFSLYAVFLSIDLALVAAARSMGASRTRALSTVVLPLALPGFVASTALVFAITIGFYVTPVLLGGAQTPFMASVIQDNVLNYFNYPLASAASVMLLVAALAILGLALRLVGRERLVRAVA